MTIRTAYIGLGANLGAREATLREAVRRLGALGRITAVSSLYETEPVGFLEQPAFLNAVVGLETDVPPGELVERLLGIEREMGRERTFRNAPRTLDLDLLMLGDVQMDEPGVTLPHPRLHERAFVLAPLAEIAPEAMHPGLQTPIQTLLRDLPDLSGVQQFAAPGWQVSPPDAAGTLPDH